MPKIIKYLGIDFGSSSVSVVGYEDANAEPILFYDRDLKDTWYATAMTRDSEKFFQWAFAENDVLDSLKEDIIDGKNARNVKRFMSELFASVTECRNTSGTYDFSSLERICFGYPTYTPTCTKAYCEKVSEIILEACVNIFNKADVEIICSPEPELAAKAFNEANKNVDSYNNSIKDGDLILVVDLGGYTLDMAILCASKDPEGPIRLRPLTNSESIESERMQISMGKRITGDICFQIYKGTTNDAPPTFDYSIEEQKCRFFSSGEKDTDPTLLNVIGKLPADQKITKFVLTKDQKGRSLSESKGESTVSVGIYSSTDGRTIQIGSSFLYCGDLINNYIDISLRARGGNKKISHLIFTGGTSRISELRETIKNKLSGNAFVDHDLQLLLVDRPAEGALTLLKANDSDSERLSSSNVVALGAAVEALRKDDSAGGGYISGSVGDSDKAKCEMLIKRNEVLENMILDFFNNGELCEKCHSEFSKLLEDMEYPY